MGPGRVGGSQSADGLGAPRRSGRTWSSLTKDSPFPDQLPATYADLAQQMLGDPYVLDTCSSPTGSAAYAALVDDRLDADLGDVPARGVARRRP